MVEVLSQIVKPFVGVDVMKKLGKVQDGERYISLYNQISAAEDSVIWKGRVKLADHFIYLMLERTRLIIIEDSPQESAHDGQQEQQQQVFEIELSTVYAVKPHKHDIGKFVVCTLLNRHEVENFEFECESVRESYLWVHLLINVIWLSGEDDTKSTIIEGLDEKPMDELIIELPVRRILCIVNPFGGDKTALDKFNTKCIPILSECPGIETQLITTERAGHALDICQSLDLDSWDEIACAGGDGIVNEVLNGLMKHPYWQKAIKIPVCNIPTGTSNALATSVLGEKNVALAAFSIARGFTQPLDIMSNFQGNERTYSFLCLMYGFLSNVTHKTDFLRKFHIGGLRNKLGAFKELMLKRSYGARLTFVPYKCRDEEVDEYMENNSIREKDEDRDVCNEKYMLKRHKQQRTNIYRNKLIFKRELIFNHMDDSFPTKDGPDCPLLLKYFEGGFMDLPNLNKPKQVAHEKMDPYDSVTSGQVRTMEDDFFGILACNTSHIAAGFPLGMASYTNSEFVDLLWIKRQNTSRRAFMKHFLKMEHENDVLMADHESIDFARTQCFKLEPLEEGTVISIDGEESKFTTTYVEIHPGMMNYICL